MRVVITGASRGIGREFARQFLARGETVEAAVRSPENARLQELASERGVLRLQSCDVASDQNVRTFADSLEPGPVDLLINNAGIRKPESIGLDDLDLDDVAETIQVNAIAALRVTRALLARIRESHIRKIVSISSGLGSIGDNTSGGGCAYRMSKAALNMATRSMAVDLARDRIICVVINPGWVKTDMGGPEAPLTVHESVSAMLRVIDALKPEQSGTFLDCRGGTYPW
ncbi:MAG: SDR family oxidoreductase [Deltaproteobacteria bacterium]|nr:SDR family oxidoreductase [Deltaproteobacteria bacterium]